MSVEKVAVLGGGLMGSGIAESVARAGLEVTIRDVDEAAVAGDPRPRLLGEVHRLRYAVFLLSVDHLKWREHR
jgi:3-hydroxyisobutyrate dehydrogenase-like beta-hydroxyacid dehydrogenase